MSRYNQHSLNNNYVEYRYISNSLRRDLGTGNGGWHQEIGAISVNGEEVNFPVAPHNDPNLILHEASATTILQNGEHKGAKVIVTRLSDDNAVREESGQNYGRKAYWVYKIRVENIHTNIDIRVSYSPVGTQEIIAFSEVIGVEAGVYKAEDFAGGRNGWANVVAGTYTYNKYMPDGNTYYGWQDYHDLRYKNLPGYYKGYVEIKYDGRTTKSAVNLTNGYYYAEIPTVATGKIATVRFIAEPMKYKVSYDPNNGYYPDGFR